jgi:hypothetical protein
MYRRIYDGWNARGNGVFMLVVRLGDMRHDGARKTMLSGIREGLNGMRDGGVGRMRKGVVGKRGYVYAIKQSCPQPTLRQATAARVKQR